jgi:hypothetical protein
MKSKILMAIASFAVALALSACATSDEPRITSPVSYAGTASETIQENLYTIFGSDQPITFTTVVSSVGDNASGVVVAKTANDIQLDITPCLKKKTIVTFVAPYKESSITDERCGDKTFPRVQVIQLGGGWRQ